MKNTVSQLIITSALAFSALTVEAAGFRQVHVSDAGHPDLVVGLWYPSEQAPPAVANTEFGWPVALNALMSNNNRALIVMSHGFGGWYAGHADTAAALADEGFIVAAPTHTGNTWSDMSSSIDQWTLDRPRHISRVIDHVLTDESLSTAIDDDKIGVYGFSAGGYTALSLIGAVPDLHHAGQFCQSHPEEYVCAEGMIAAMREADMQALPANAWGADARVKAAVIAAPGFGFAYTEASLAEVVAQVQLWSGELDENVPTPSNAASLAERLPRVPETHWIEKANHFAFMIVNCRAAFKQAEPEEYEEICGDIDGFDRWAFHDTMNSEMARFFTKSLAVEP